MFTILRRVKQGAAPTAPMVADETGGDDEEGAEVVNLLAHIGTINDSIIGIIKICNYN